MNGDSGPDDDLLPEEEEREYTSSDELMPRFRLPRPVARGIVVLFGALITLAIVAEVVFGLANSTWWYGGGKVDVATRSRLARLQAELATAGAPDSALRAVTIAARPDVNSNEVLDALLEADKALEPQSGQPAIASARQELRAIYNDLYRGQRGGTVPTQLPAPGR